MQRAYNRAGLVTSETYPSLKVFETEYDSAGRIAGVSRGGDDYAGGQASDAANRIQYSPAGAVNQMKLGNGLWEHTDFNSRLQPKLIGLGASATASGTFKLEYDYGTTNNSGNMLNQKITAPTGTGSLLLTQTYTYDKLLTANEKVNQESTARWTQSFNFDRWGNRTGLTNTGELPPGNQLTLNPATNRFTALTYDEAGNQLSDASGHPLGYDAENHQKTFTSGGITYTYSYDGDGRRVKKEYNDGTAHITVFVYNASGQLIAEYNSDPVPPVQGGGGVGYLTADHLGSTRVVTNSTGGVKARHDYLPFGEDVGSNMGSRSIVVGYDLQDGVRQKFTQKERDNESGLGYFGARYYSGAEGRFTSVDPNESVLTRQTSTESGEREFSRDLAQPQHWNRYSYVLNNPLRLIDPDGRKWTESVQLGNAMLNVFAPPGTVLDLGSFLAHTRGVNFFYKDPGIEWAKISTAGGSPENGGCVLGCWETYEAQPVALSLRVRFDIDEKSGKVNGVAVDLGRQDVISSGQNPLRTVWSPLPGLGRPAAEVTSVQINTGVLRGLTNQQLQAVANAFRRPQRGGLGPIAAAINQAVADEQKRRQEEERKRQEEEEKKRR